MKKYISILILCLSFTAAQSQDVTDALRLSQDNTNGTARFRAMSGAFGALGGDLSAINVNPAGSVVFSNNQFAASLNNYNTKNSSNYFGTKTKETNNSFDLNQAGAVFVFNNNDKRSDWKKFAVAVNYDNANNLDNKILSAGTNQNSVANYFLSYANQFGITTADLDYYYYDELNYQDQQAFLGYQAYIINPVTTNPNNSSYTSNVSSGGNYYQQNTFTSKGYNGKLSFNASAQYQDWLSVGLNLNSHFTDYRQTTSFYESNSNSNTTGVKNLKFNNELYTYGTGFSFQVGAIAKASKEIRLGLAYQSSTWFTLNDELTQSISSSGYNYGNPANPALSTVANDPKVINVYDPYGLRTPGKWTGSFAYIFGKKGLISIDYAIKDYSKAQFTPKDQFKNSSNNTDNNIPSWLKRSAELRLGAEYKIKQWSLRGGYRFEQSPYKDKKTVGDLKGYSTGLGYNFGNTKLDLAFSHSERDSQYQFFQQGLTDRAAINAINNNVTLTLAFEL
jgi:hypothetical protein